MKKLFIAAAVLSICICAPAIAEEQQVEPTQAEIDYMNKLDTHIGDNFGGNDKVDGSVTQSESGDRKIHLDYSKTQGSEITADPPQDNDGN